MIFTNNIAFAISLGLLALSYSCLLDLGLRRNLYELERHSGAIQQKKKKIDEIRFPFFLGAISNTNWTQQARQHYIRVINSIIKIFLFVPFFLSFHHWNTFAHNINPGSSSLFSSWKYILRSSSKLSCANNSSTSIKACLVVHCVDNLAARALYHVIITVS